MADSPRNDLQTDRRQTVDRVIATRVSGLRARAGLSLDALAKVSSVSRSMLSAVERGERKPTVLVLDRIATALGTTVARLVAVEQTDRLIVIRSGAHATLVDPSGWERRILSPVLQGVEFEFLRATLGPGVDAGTYSPHGLGSREYVAIEKGTLALTVGERALTLEGGDSIYYAGDAWHAFRNPSPSDPCVYYLAMDVAGGHGEASGDVQPSDDRE